MFYQERKKARIYKNRKIRSIRNKIKQSNFDLMEIKNTR